MNNPWEQTDPNGTAQQAENSFPPKQEASPASEPVQNVDKIRDILFGSHMRDYDARFGRLEQMLARESAELRDATRKRMDTLEDYVKKELDALHVRFKGERDERASSLSSLAAELKQMAESLSRKISDVDDQTAAAHHELRDKFLEHGREMADQLDRKHRETNALLEERFQELRKDKTDRSALANLFNEVALRLTGEFHLPGAGQ